jgi:hypothetical protein
VRGLGEAPVQAIAELVGVVGRMGAPLARDDGAGGGDAGEAREPDQLPRRSAHPRVGYGR